VWGTYAYLGLEDARLLDAATTLARRTLADIDRACSRFRRDSDLSLANRRPGRWTTVDPLLVAAVQAGLDAARETDGLLDPCLGRTIVSLGYDRDLDQVVRKPQEQRAIAPPRPGAWTEVGLDEAAVRVPHGVALDLGSTAKAWAADLVAELLADRLEVETAVSLGGDVRVLSPAGRRASWPVRVAEHPDDLGDGVEVLLSGGLATSSTVVRRWRAGTVARHHLIDPRTGLPVEGGFRTVTAVGHSCLAANTASTAAVVLGTDAPAWLAARGVTARLVAEDGSVTTVGAWPTDSSSKEER
jgi:thiamine biosynthesis lipoprotein